LPQDVADVRRHQQLTDLVLNRRNRFLQEFFVIVFKFIDPKRPHHWVFDLLDHPRPIPGVRQHPLDAEQRHIFAIQKGGTSGVEDVFQTRPPEFRPDRFEHTHHARRDQMPFIRRDGTEQIEADWMFHVGRVEIRHILNAMAGHVVQQVIRQIAVRINDGDAMPGFNVLQNQIAEQGGFARPAFPDGV
jgi:hypothetical protein